MIARFFLILCLALAPVGAAADEKAVRDRIVRELRGDGYQEIRLFRTFLGRLRFVGEDGRSRREIIVSPTTGVILRDYVRFFDDDDDDERDDDDDFDDDEDDDDYDDESDDDETDDETDDDDDDDDESDNSGSGSSNSGSGSSNSGSGSDDD